MKNFAISFTANELEYIRTEIDCLMRHYRHVFKHNRRRARRSYSNKMWQHTRPYQSGSYDLWTFNNPNMITALNKLYFAACAKKHANMPSEFFIPSDMPITANGVTTFSFTKKEAKHLVNVLDHMLREFSLEGYHGRKFTNPVCANAFDKIYKALTGVTHPNVRPEHYNSVVTYHFGPNDSRRLAWLK